jgi:hypothetical protein
MYVARRYTIANGAGIAPMRAKVAVIEDRILSDLLAGI